MKRYILGTILLVLAVELALVIPLLVFTPLGVHLLHDLAPSPPPTPILTVVGTARGLST